MNRSIFVPTLFVLALAGCAGQVAHQQGIDLFAQGRQEEGLAKLAQAAREAPDRQIYLQAYRNALARIDNRLLAQAQREREIGEFDAAEATYRHVLRLDPGSGEAAAGLADLARSRAHVATMEEARALMAANDLDGAERKAQDVLREDARQPQARELQQAILQQREAVTRDTRALDAGFRKPVTLEFRDANLRQVLEALAVHSGLNFVLDKDVPPTLTVTVFLRDVTVEHALDLILKTRQLRSRVLGDRTVMIYPDTAAKLSDNQELVVRNFFLANAEAKQVVNMLKTVLRARSVFADDKLNLIVMRDTPATISLAERLVATQDVAEPEVMLELAVMEVTRSRLQSIGLVLPSQLTLAPIPTNTTTGLTLTDLKHLNADRLGAAISPIVINLQDDSNGENLLANPRIRTHSREKAVIRIGDRVPVITTTATSTGFVSENVQYLDVGLKLEVEPTVFPDDEIGIKLGLEVSNVIAQVTSKAGTVAYQVGSRNAATVLRLKDGETQILGGLINDDDVRSANRFPGLSALPVLGRLFSNDTNNNQKRELVLTVTPRIVRGLSPPMTVPAKFWSGTETTPGLRPAVEAVGNAGVRAPVLTLPSAPPPAAPLPVPGAPGPLGPQGAPPRGPELQPDQPGPGAQNPPPAPPGLAMPVVPPGAPTPPAAPATTGSEPQFGPAFVGPAAVPTTPMTTGTMPAPPAEPPQP
jgi:general secretion pathway protein D